MLINTSERHQWSPSGFFIVKSEHILIFFIVFIADFKQVNVCWLYDEIVRVANSAVRVL